MFEVMRQKNLYEPLYVPPHISPHSVLLVLFNLERVEYWDIVNKFLEIKYRITNQQARQITGIRDTLKMFRVCTYNSQPITQSNRSNHNVLDPDWLP